jgi:hypothetical protein
MCVEFSFLLCTAIQLSVFVDALVAKNIFMGSTVSKLNKLQSFPFRLFISVWKGNSHA